MTKVQYSDINTRIQNIINRDSKIPNNILNLTKEIPNNVFEILNEHIKNMIDSGLSLEEIEDELLVMENLELLDTEAIDYIIDGTIYENESSQHNAIDSTKIYDKDTPILTILIMFLPIVIILYFLYTS